MTAPISTLVCAHCGKREPDRAERARRTACGNCGKPLPWLVDAETKTFEVEAKASPTVVIDLWAPWCGPCRLVSRSWSSSPASTPAASRSSRSTSTRTRAWPASTTREHPVDVVLRDGTSSIGSWAPAQARPRGPDHAPSQAAEGPARSLPVTDFVPVDFQAPLALDHPRFRLRPLRPRAQRRRLRRLDLEHGPHPRHSGVRGKPLAQPDGSTRTAPTSSATPPTSPPAPGSPTPSSRPRTTPWSAVSISTRRRGRPGRGGPLLGSRGRRRSGRGPLRRRHTGSPRRGRFDGSSTHPGRDLRI